MSSALKVALSLAAVLSAGRALRAQDYPPVIVDAQPDPSDPGSILLTYQDGWSNGVQGPIVLDQTWIRGATFPPDPYGLDYWFETNARDLAVEGGIPAPGLPEGYMPPGLEQQVAITGLEPETTYFIAVRGGVFEHAIPVDPESGWLMVTTGAPLPPDPTPPPPSPESGKGSGGAGGCGSAGSGAAGRAAMFILFLLPGFRRTAEGMPAKEGV